MKSSGSTILTAGAKPAPFTDVRIGDVVLVTVDRGVVRPLTVTSFELHPQIGALVSGQITTEPTDHNLDAFRGTLPCGRMLTRRVDALVFVAFAERLSPGVDLGQWRRRD